MYVIYLETSQRYVYICVKGQWITLSSHAGVTFPLYGNYIFIPMKSRKKEIEITIHERFWTKKQVAINLAVYQNFNASPQILPVAKGRWSEFLLVIPIFQSRKPASPTEFTVLKFLASFRRKLFSFHFTQLLVKCGKNITLVNYWFSDLPHSGFGL